MGGTRCPRCHGPVESWTVRVEGRHLRYEVHPCGHPLTRAEGVALEQATAPRTRWFRRVAERTPLPWSNRDHRGKP